MLPALFLAQLAGAGINSIGSYYDAKTQKYGLLSAAQQAEFDASMSDLNARQSEQDAQATLDAGQRRAGLVSLRYGQEQGALRADTGASGIQAGVGSAAEVAASVQAAKALDMGVITQDSVRAAWGRRAEATNAQNAALLSRTEAAHLRRSAKAVNPYVAGASTLFGGVSQVASRWVPRTYPDYAAMRGFRRADDEFQDY